MPTLNNLPSPSYRVTLSPASCSLDLGDGSERGEYVDQDYILSALGRPHRSINLMYCYYPFDKGWPQRASAAHKPKGSKPWPYPYDDYFPFTGGPKGNTEGEVFRQMRDIRRHGQDVTLTLTMDCAVPDGHIRVIARQLKPFGRMRLRLNHECDGDWFSFNRRYTYAQVGAFFVRFAGILKDEAPQVRLICCWGHVKDPGTGLLNYEKELSPILGASDIWSTDKYLSLHWGWPTKDCEPEDRGKTFFASSVRKTWNNTVLIHKRFTELAGKDKGIEIGEFNYDGNVGGVHQQARSVDAFYRKILGEKPKFLKAVTLYQFRDRGRLGLEREDPNHPGNGIPTPLMWVYRELLRQSYFQPKEKWVKRKGPLRMEWRASDDSDGLGWRLPLRKRPLFLELLLEKKANLMVWAGHKWIYKKPGVEWVDLTESAVEWGVAKPFPIRLFAPPAEGTNPDVASRAAGSLSGPPRMRIRYDWKFRRVI